MTLNPSEIAAMLGRPTPMSSQASMIKSVLLLDLTNWGSWEARLESAYEIFARSKDKLVVVSANPPKLLEIAIGHRQQWASRFASSESVQLWRMSREEAEVQVQRRYSQAVLQFV